MISPILSPIVHWRDRYPQGYRYCDRMGMQVSLLLMVEGSGSDLDLEREAAGVERRDQAFQGNGVGLFWRIF